VRPGPVVPFVRSAAIDRSGPMVATLEDRGPGGVAGWSWDASTGRSLLEVAWRSRAGGAVAVTAGGGILAAKGAGSVSRWDPRDGRRRAICSLVKPARAVVTNADATVIAAGGNDGVARVFGPDGRIRTEINCARPGGQSFVAIRSLALDAPGRLLATGEQFGRVKVWDTESGELLTDAGRQSRWIGGLAFSPDSRSVAFGDGDGNVVIRGLAAGAGTVIGRHQDGVLSAAFSPDGGSLVTGGQDRTVILWNLTDPSSPIVMRDLSGWIQTAGFDVSGTRVRAIDRGGEFGMWDISGRFLHRMRRGGYADASARNADGETMPRWQKIADECPWSTLNCGCGRGAQHVPADFWRLVLARSGDVAIGAGVADDVETGAMLFDSMVPVCAMSMAALREDGLDAPVRRKLIDLVLSAVSGETHHVEVTRGIHDLEVRCRDIVRPDSDLLRELTRTEADPGIRERLAEILESL
jgi:WD domain, G-beta repeat